MRVLAFAWLLLGWLGHVPALQAACSAYMGQAAINEIYTGTGTGAGRFYEVRLLAGISSAVYSTWTLRICTSGGSCTTVGLVNSDGDSYLLNSSTPSTSFFNLGNIDLVLRDGSGNAIDYLSTGSTTGQYAGLGCTSFPYDTTAATLASNTRDLRRSPDGTGDWTSSPGNSGGNTPDSSNGGSSSGAIAAFRIFHAGTAINCLPAPVTIRAVDSAGNTVLGFTGTVSLATSTGNGTWLIGDGFGTLVNSGSDTGTATYTFSSLDGGDVELQLSNAHAESVNINVTYGSIWESASYDPNLVFMPEGFAFFAAGNPSLPPQVAARGFAGGPYTLRAVSTDASNNQCTALLGVAGSIGLAAECEDPTTCTANPLYGGAALAINPNDNVTAYSSAAVNFVNGETTLAAMSYADAGQLRLHARATLTIGGQSKLLTGTSNAFVVRPFGFALAVPGNPAAADATGAPFKRAGEAFPATVRAVAWQAADDGNNDGVPDAGANLADNATTPGFGRHVSAPLVNLTQTLVSPTGGALGTLTGGGALGVFNNPANGEKSVSLSWDEVGVLALTARVDNYLGSGLLESTLSPVGRFYPDHFDLAVTGYGPACAAGIPSFTYAGLTGSKPGQSFPVSASVCACKQGASCVTALGACTNTTLQNFDSAGAYASRVASANAELRLGAAAFANGTLALNSALVFTDGAATLSNVPGTVSFNASTPLGATQAPAALDLRLSVCDHNGSAPLDQSCTGADDATGTATSAAAVDYRLGRLRLVSASAPVDQALALPAVADFWNGVSWQTHSADNCTAPSGALATLGPYGGNLGAGETAAAGGPGLNAGQSTGLVSLSAPGAGNDGTVGVLLALNGGNNFPWLLEDWNGNGSMADDPGPRAVASFGLYRGSDRVVEWREIGQ